MNDIVTDKRNSLLVQTISSLMFLRLNGPGLTDFDPLPFVKSWLTSGGRLSTSWKPGPSANWFNDKKRVHTWVV